MNGPKPETRLRELDNEEVGAQTIRLQHPKIPLLPPKKNGNVESLKSLLGQGRRLCNKDSCAPGVMYWQA